MLAHDLVQQVGGGGARRWRWHGKSLLNGEGGVYQGHASKGTHAMTDRTDTDCNDQSAVQPADLPPAAQRALAEATERRLKAQATDLPKELGGRREGLEAVRYGDWEKKGIAIDF
jgi:hypothetical protein